MNRVISLHQDPSAKPATPATVRTRALLGAGILAANALMMVWLEIQPGRVDGIVLGSLALLWMPPLLIGVLCTVAAGCAAVGREQKLCTGAIVALVLNGLAVLGTASVWWWVMHTLVYRA
jgi:hypothetical protein